MAGGRPPPTTPPDQAPAPSPNPNLRIDRRLPTTQAGPTIVTIAGASDLQGTITVPGDKSISHRAIMLSAIAEGASRIDGLSDGADVRHTMAAVRALGATVETLDDGAVMITGGSMRASDDVIDLGNSGTGIRLFAGIVAGLPFRTVLDGDDSVRGRPMDRVVVPLELMGAQIDGRGDRRFAPLVVRGRQLHGIDYSTPVASAQIKSSILLAGLHAVGPTIVREPSVSRRHTEEMLAARGASITIDGTTTSLEPSTLGPLDISVAGDPSQAAFWLCTASALPGSHLTVSDIYLGPARDGFLDVLRRMGAQLEVVGGHGGSSIVHVTGTQLSATDVEPGEIPGLIDEIPILAVTAALAEGVTRVRGARELRVKESDRLATIAEMLRRFGITVLELEDGLEITGGHLSPATVDSHGDHRIAMAAAMAAATIEGTTRIAHFEVVATSYPGFLLDLARCAPEASISA